MHVPRHTCHEDGGTAVGCVGGRAHHARRRDVAALEGGKHSGLRRYRADAIFLVLGVGYPAAQDVLPAPAVLLDRQPVDRRCDTAGEPTPADHAGTAPDGSLNPRQRFDWRSRVGPMHSPLSSGTPRASSCAAGR